MTASTALGIKVDGRQGSYFILLRDLTLHPKEMEGLLLEGMPSNGA